jgi:hypothetical protein
MKFPKQRLRFMESFDGRKIEGGYLVLDIKGLDIEGANALVVEITDIESARAIGDREQTAKDRARELLGG